MRLLVVGRLSGQLSAAVKMAMSAGAKVAHVETIAQATSALRAGQGADLMMVDYDLDIAALISNARQATETLNATLVTANGSIERIDRDVVRQLPMLMDKLDSTVGKLDSVAGNANAMIAENRPAVVESRQEAAFRTALGAAGVQARLAGQVKGLDYSNGQRMTLNIYEARETADQGAQP